MLDLTLRCFSRARWQTVARNRGILDANNNPKPGFSVDEIGSIVLTPAVFDAQFIETTPAVMDTWFWVNLRISAKAFQDDTDTVFPGEEGDVSGFKFTRSKLVRWIREQSTPVTLTYKQTSIRTYQFATGTNRIQLIDPRDYDAVRVREWLGGQQW